MLSGNRGSRKADYGNVKGVDDIMGAREWSVRMGWSAGCRVAALSVGYVALYLTLDRLSFIGALHGIGITPWSPSTGLAIALLIINGLHAAPLVLAAELLSGVTLPLGPVSLVSICLASLLVTAGYTGAAAILRFADLQTGILRSSDIVLLLIVTIISSGLVASGFVTSYAALGVIPWSGFVEAVFHFWIGDAIGIVVLAPPLLLLYERFKQRSPSDHGSSWRQLLEFAVQGASIVAALAAIFSGIGGDPPLELFYLLFLPLIWIATRDGLTGASWAILAIQTGLIIGLQIQGYSAETLRNFQLLMFALAATGLMLGAVVSERRRLWNSLLDSERRRAAILNTARDGIITLDARGTIQSINPAVERMFAHPSHGLIGNNVSELVKDAPELLRRVKLVAHSPASEAASWELDARRADGRTFPIEFSAGYFSLSGGEQYTIVIRDITLRRKAEARYREHQAELAHISRVSLAGEMAAGLAHELSQPLTAIAAYARGCLRFLAESVLDPILLREGVTEIVEQAERAGDVLDRLREFVRGGEHQRTPIEVEFLIDAALSLTRVEAKQRQVEIEARVDAGLPAVLADQIQIEQVLLNLLRNAMDAMEVADIARRRISVEARRKSSYAVEISVADSGPGVPTEVVDTIFEPFVTTKPCGMGMGLSISRSIVESHGGSLRMLRGDCPGGTFIFDLPIAEAEAEPDAR
jgi:two-component system sensor kinase FixL